MVCPKWTCWCTVHHFPVQNIGSTLRKHDFPDFCLHSHRIFWISFAFQEARSSCAVVLPFLSQDRGESSYVSVHNFIKPFFFCFEQDGLYVFYFHSSVKQLFSPKSLVNLESLWHTMHCPFRPMIRREVFALRLLHLLCSVWHRYESERKRYVWQSDKYMISNG